MIFKWIQHFNFHAACDRCEYISWQEMRERDETMK